MRSAASLLICLALPAVLAAQAQPTVAEHIALGDSAHAALAPQQALGHYRAALAHDSTNRSEEHTSELQSRSDLVCRLLLEKKKHQQPSIPPVRSAAPDYSV